LDKDEVSSDPARSLVEDQDQPGPSEAFMTIEGYDFHRAIVDGIVRQQLA
jgi:hypothetical protein